MRVRFPLLAPKNMKIFAILSLIFAITSSTVRAEDETASIPKYRNKYSALVKAWNAEKNPSKRKKIEERIAKLKKSNERLFAN